MKYVTNILKVAFTFYPKSVLVTYFSFRFPPIIIKSISILIETLYIVNILTDDIVKHKNHKEGYLLESGRL